MTLSQNVTFFISVHSHKVWICKINSALTLIRFIQTVAVALSFLYCQMNIRYISIVFEFKIGVEWYNFHLCQKYLP